MFNLDINQGNTARRVVSHWYRVSGFHLYLQGHKEEIPHSELDDTLKQMEKWHSRSPSNIGKMQMQANRLGIEYRIGWLSLEE